MHIYAQVRPRDRLHIWVSEHLQRGLLYLCLEMAVSKYPVLCCVCCGHPPTELSETHFVPTVSWLCFMSYSWHGARWALQGLTDG